MKSVVFLSVLRSQEYEDIAVRLGNDTTYRKAIRAKVWKSRITSTLFDTKNYAKEIEGVFSKIWHRHAKGLPPDHIVNSGGSSPDSLEKVNLRLIPAYVLHRLYLLKYRIVPSLNPGRLSNRNLLFSFLF